MERVGRWVASHPRWVIGAIVVITLAFAAFIPRIGYETDVDSMLPRGDPVIDELRQAVEDFGSQDVLLVLFAAEDVFRPSALAEVDRVARDLGAIRGVKAVTTPLNLQVVRGSDLGIEIEPAAAQVPRTQDEVDRFRERLFFSPQGRALASPGGEALAMLVTLDPAYTYSPERFHQIVAEVESRVNRGQGGRWYLVGDPYMGIYADRVIRSDLRVLTPLAALAVILLLLAAFRTPWGLILPLASVSIAVTWTVGLMAALGYDLTIVSMIIPVILLAMGSAAGIHMMNRYYEEVGRGLGPREAVEATMAGITVPVIMTALTTAAGFVSLLTSFIQPVREFALFSAAGILFAMVVSLTFIPAVLVSRPIPAHLRRPAAGGAGGSWRLLTWVGTGCHRRPVWITGLGAAILLVSLGGIPALQVETNLMSYFRQGSPVVEGTRLVERFFGGTTPISVVVDSGEPDGVKDPAFLGRLAQLENDLAAIPGVSQPLSVAGVVAQVNRALNGDDPAAYRIPDTRPAVAQELLLFEFAGGAGLDGLVTYDYRKVNLSARIANVGTAELARIIGQVESSVRDRFQGRGIDPQVVGTAKVVLRLGEQFTEGQVRSMSWAAGVVWVIVAALLGSPLLGLVALVPLLLTVAVTFGVMGYAGVPLDVVTTMVASLAIGIGVDYSIHLVSRYRQEVSRGATKGEALATTLTGTGRGVVVNAATLVVGFGVLMFSGLQATATLGWLLALTMVVSSLGALTVLPAVLSLLPEARVRSRVPVAPGASSR
ncbi:efflux RND transporter permease subunit [Limnochorda pilosa]|uniref:SSD domain-containing protein n=1 Tax=Limnochorda pilosa TaxID=1555112 RepID=A0A0K2SNA8_LIMPI|nr:MMPL family transporter [Limnochorda pilosa]BAS28487.1 hypothetical protein LIP_2657 [Limnochorda pilosa]